MIIDSNTFGWLIATAIAVYVVFKYWKRVVKFAIFAVIAVFILFVVQIKEMIDVVITPKPPVSTQKKEKIEVKARYDTINNTIEIEDIDIINK